MSSKLGADHKKQITRINRIEGQVRGIKSMIEEDKYCIDIINQIKAIRSALKSVEFLILEKHLNCCVKDAACKDNKKDINEKIDELMKIIKSSCK
jgi:DNA-binding FrmR family transcriptional regulator